MSHLQFFSYPGWGEKTRENMHMNQSVRVGEFITISGQGGWDPRTSSIPIDIAAEVEQAFANVELALKDAGGKGWSQVFRLTLFAVDMSEACLGAIKASMEKWMPGHKPVVTGVGVAALAIPGMTVEIEVWAHDPGEPQSSMGGTGSQDNDV